MNSEINESLTNPYDLKEIKTHTDFMLLTSQVT